MMKPLEKCTTYQAHYHGCPNSPEIGIHGGIYQGSVLDLFLGRPALPALHRLGVDPEEIEQAADRVVDDVVDTFRLV